MESAADRPVLAVDLGGTQIRAALITPAPAVRARRAEPTRDSDGPDAVVERLVEMVAAVRAEAARSGAPMPVGVGISSPGPLDPWRGIVLDPPNLDGWTDVPLAERVRDALNLPVFVERDTNVAAQAEGRYGAARGARDFVYLTVSTGVGGAAVIDGRPLRGRDGTAGEFGHLVVELDGPHCGCGGQGHVEAMASGTALAREARALVVRRPNGPLARLAAAAEADAALLARAAEAGDRDSRALLEQAWVAIGVLCASIVNALDPEIIVIGGGIAEHQPRLFEVARAELARRVLPVHAGRTRLEPASLGPDVSLIGCLPIVQERIGDPRFDAASHRPRKAAAQQGVLRP